jgi:hypothetical protein
MFQPAILSTVLECTHLATGNGPIFLDEKAILELWVKDDLSSGCSKDDS